MNLEAALMILGLTLCVMVFFALAIESRCLTRTVYFFFIQSVAMILIFTVYALYTPNYYLFIWAGVWALLNAYLLPFFPGGLLYTARRMEGTAHAAPLGTIIYIVLALLALLVIGSRLKFSLTAPTADGRVNLNLVLAMLLSFYGVVSLLTHRHPFKMVLGLMMMVEGAHLSLIHLGAAHLAVVKIGVLMKVVPSIFMILYVNRMISAKLKVHDTRELSLLKH